MNLEKRQNTWYAVLTKPPDVWPVLGRKRWVQSTKTGNRNKAQVVAAILVAGWKAEITKARGKLPSPADTLLELLRHDYVKAQALDRESDGDGGGDLAQVVRDLIQTAAEKIADPEESSLMYRVAIGMESAPVLLTPLVTAWVGSLRSAQKTIDQASRDMHRMADHFKYLDALTPQKVKAWTDKLIAGGMTAASLERIGKACRALWAYFQQTGVKAMLDPDPFLGPFKLAMTVAVRNKTGRSGSSYTPQQLTDLYAAAIAKDDKPLADLIALGAYTGARIEELCTITKDTAEGGVFRIGTKTTASRRDCPIHPSIVPLVARLLANSADGYLVASTADNQYGNRSGPLSQRFGHLKKELGYGPSHVFHSTRNTLATMMERAGVPEGIAADVVGHAKKTMTYGLYSSGSGEQQKLEAISKVTYPAPLDAP